MHLGAFNFFCIYVFGACQHLTSKLSSLPDSRLPEFYIFGRILRIIKMSALERATAQVSYTAAQFSRAADQVPQLESVLEALEVQLFTVQTNAQTVVAANVAHLIAKWKWKDAEQQLTTVKLEVAELVRKQQHTTSALATARFSLQRATVALHAAEEEQRHATKLAEAEHYRVMKLAEAERARVSTLHYLSQSDLIVPYFVTAAGVIKRPESHISWWKCRIFAYLGPNNLMRFHLRRLCRLFRDSLPPAEVWRFPHPKFSTLNKLVNRINAVAIEMEDPSKASMLVLISNGVHLVEGNNLEKEYERRGKRPPRDLPVRKKRLKWKKKWGPKPKPISREEKMRALYRGGGLPFPENDLGALLLFIVWCFFFFCGLVGREYFFP